MLLELMILSLMTWRLTSLLVKEDGPFDFLERFRYVLGVRYDEHSRRYGTNILSRGVICVWCASVWVGFATAFLSSYAVNLRTFTMMWFALSAATILIDSIIERMNAGI